MGHQPFLRIHSFDDGGRWHPGGDWPSGGEHMCPIGHGLVDSGDNMHMHVCGDFAHAYADTRVCPRHACSVFVMYVVCMHMCMDVSVRVCSE